MKNNYKILYFEDDEDFARILDKVLNDRGFECKHYECPPDKREELISLVLSENPDLIIMDILMPKIDGFMATKIIKGDSRTKNIPIIGSSNMGDQETLNKAKECGMVDYIFITGTTIEQFIGRVKKYLPNTCKLNPSSHKENKPVNNFERANKSMKNRTLAIFGIAAYILSVLSSAADLEENSTAPVALIAISGIATLVFIIMATIRLWEEVRWLSITFASSTIILLVLTGILEFTSPLYGSPIIILLNIVKMINFFANVLVIVYLFRLKDKK